MQQGIVNLIEKAELSLMILKRRGGLKRATAPSSGKSIRPKKIKLTIPLLTPTKWCPCQREKKTAEWQTGLETRQEQGVAFAPGECTSSEICHSRVFKEA